MAPVILRMTPVILYVTAVILRMTAVMLKMTAVILYVTPVILRMTAVMLKMTPFILYVTPVTLTVTPVILTMTAVSSRPPRLRLTPRPEPLYNSYNTQKTSLLYREETMNRVSLLRGALAVVVFLLAGGAAAQAPVALTSGQGPEPEMVQPLCILPPHTQQSPDPTVYGAWNTVIPAAGGGAIERILGMQTVHTAVLPSGKILLVSGSSWRNLAPIEYYPEHKDPAAPKGIFIRGEEPFRDSKIDWYYQLVNNAAIYDPENNTFYRIPHPAPVPDPKRPGHFAPNDLFCTGQQHLPDGDVLFTGGTQYYSPYRTGNNSTWIFDWKKETTIDWRTVDWRQRPTSAANNPWIFSGFMQRGRWYPTLVPLLDGRMVLFSGYVGFDPGYPEMYVFEINHFIEFFDPNVFDAKDPQKAWKSIDVTNTPNSPFTRVINPDFKPTPQYKDACYGNCVHDNQRDAFKLYPENYLMPDGRIYLTREGDWVSLRTCDTAFMRRTKLTYWATVGGTPADPKVSFSPGPDRPEEITSYGTTYLDPNSGEITLLGGQPTSAGLLYPVNLDNGAPSHFAGGRATRKKETFHYAPSEPLGGRWTLDDPNFLGDTPQDDRTMHYALILPTRQILVINGGNFDFYGPVHYPWLLTPKYDKKNKFAGYDKLRVAEAVEPRLYHNAALLMPDGRIWISGGNTSRATVHSAPPPQATKAQTEQPKPDLSLVDVDMYFFNDGPMAKGEKGMLTTPTEDWVAEIYSPPYLFIDPDRQAHITALQPASPPGYDFSKEIGGKTYYLLHSNQKYGVELADLPSDCSGKAPALELIKLPSATHGWENGQKFVGLTIGSGGTTNAITFTTPDAKTSNIPPAYYMLFYVDCKGKPSVARMVRFDDMAKEP